MSKLQTIRPLGSTSKFNFNGPLGSTSKLQTIGPLGSTSKFNFNGPLGSTSKFKPSDLWEARPNFKSIEPLGSMSKFQIHRTSGKHVCIFIYMHHTFTMVNTDCKVRCLFHTLTFTFQALPMMGILLTPYFATRI